MRCVRWLAAARNTSEAEECEYSSRKWCSTSHTESMPEPVGQLDLVERVGDQAALGVGVPRPRKLVLVEDAEAHGPGEMLLGSSRAATPAPAVQP